MRNIVANGDQSPYDVIHLGHALVMRLSTLLVNDTAELCPWAINWWAREENSLIDKSKTGSFAPVIAVAVAVVSSHSPCFAAC